MRRSVVSIGRCFLPSLVALGCASGESLGDGSEPSVTPGSSSGGAAAGGRAAGAAPSSGGGGLVSSGGALGSGGTLVNAGGRAGIDASTSDADGAGARSDGSDIDGRAGSTGTGGAGGTGGTTGSGGASTGGAPTSPTFGGVYVGNGPKCNTTACYTTNPRASGACACPSGFTASQPLNLLDDRACPSDNPPYGWSSLYACYGGSWSPAADFGGYYHHDGTTCNVGNPFAAGACACPTGAQAIEFIVDGACWNDWRIGLCWNPSAPATTFAGAYQRSDSTAIGDNGCVVPNPASGGCSCPAGSTPIDVRNIYGPGNAGCKNNGAIGGHLYVCSVD